MANVIINEFGGIGASRGERFGIPAAAGLLATQVVAIGGSSAQSAATNASTNLIKVYAEADCSVNIGTNPTAAANNGIALAAGTADYFVITPGHKVAVITRVVA